MIDPSQINIKLQRGEVEKIEVVDMSSKESEDNYDIFEMYQNYASGKQVSDNQNSLY